MNLKKSIFVMLLISNLSIAQNLTMASAINKAGKQRMLTQRMTKDFISIAAEVKVEDALRELDESASLFNENFSDLSNFVKDKDAKIALEFTGTLWAKFRARIVNTPNIVEVPSLISDAYDLTSACNVVVEKLVTSSGLKIGNLTNICGKQRMYSQKLAMLYLAFYSKSEYKNCEKELNDTKQTFESNLNILINNTTNTPEINSILKMQKEEWDFLKKSFDVDSTTLMPTSVFSSANIMLKNFDKATVLYEKLVIN